MIERFPDSIRLFVLSLFVLVTYLILNASYAVLPFDPILNAFFVHSLPALIVIVCWFKSRALFQSVVPKWIQMLRIYLSGKSSLIFFFPSILIVFVSILVTLVSKGTNAIDLSILVDRRIFLLVLFVPLVEELFFRLGVSSIIRKLSGFYAGTYLSICLFAFLHPNPLGPALLAIFCELLFLLSGRLWPAVAFHGACNLTVFIFYLVDPRWLEWLAIFYQGI